MAGVGLVSGGLLWAGAMAHTRILREMRMGWGTFQWIAIVGC